ncbi:TIGR02281 family clan AA aspartic protease [Paraglaciecola sp. L1A13]|uniref:retropepsin-like aspartic protease family protein n=1 Tax=Paraglaciecola sp. L1A13 TaxID=2686359 RepID=UPI001E4EC645|nr:TIGR02281 family clan AA aspartic protease [Paraglaciecola sp. L1A13]|tara:strand:+ start:68 stop:604 length:537 start_codon:yes stop_codon:yes gene_type:complete
MSKDGTPEATEPNQSAMGKWMLILAWGAGLGLLTLLFHKQLAEQLNPNTAPHSQATGDRIEVQLQQNRYGHYVTSGLINAQPVVFMLDTGATDVSIPSELGPSLGLKPGMRAWVQTANGRLQVARTVIAELQIGGIVLRNVTAHLNPGMMGNEILLGMSALKQVEFAQRGDMLILRSE